MDGSHEVTAGGPRRLWQAVEVAHERWNRLDRPGWDRLGFTVTPTEQTIWLDAPTGRVSGRCRSAARSKEVIASGR